MIAEQKESLLYQEIPTAISRILPSQISLKRFSFNFVGLTPDSKSVRFITLS